MGQKFGPQGRDHCGHVGFVDEMPAVGKRRFFGLEGLWILERLGHRGAPGSGLT